MGGSEFSVNIRLLKIFNLTMPQQVHVDLHVVGQFTFTFRGPPGEAHQSADPVLSHKCY